MGSTQRRWLAATLGVVGCADASPRAEAVALAANADPNASRPAASIEFADGAVIEGVILEPRQARPGHPVKVQLDIAGGSGDLQIIVVPPRAGSRQVVARGGVWTRGEDDPRTQQRTVSDPEGTVTASVDLPAPWHPRTAMVLARRDAPAVAGPRTQDGWAVLGLLPIEPTPTRVVAMHTAAGSITIDGDANEPGWGDRPIALVHSVDGEPHAGAPTEVRFAWDDEALYVTAHLPDSDVWTTYADQDDPLWKQEVFEVFVAAQGDGTDYLEYQVSARGVTFDSKFAEYRKGSKRWDSTWTTAVDVRGTLDDRTDRDEGWTVEVAIPWAELCEHTRITCPPTAGASFRVNAFRMERPLRASPYGLALSPTRKPDFHAWQNAAVLELAKEAR